MRRKTFLICLAAILQLCFFTGCSDEKNKDTSENDTSAYGYESSEITSVVSEISTERSSEESDISVTDETDNIIPPEMNIEVEPSVTSVPVSEHAETTVISSNTDINTTASDEITSATDDEIVITTAAITAESEKNTKGNDGSEVTTEKTNTAAMISESVTTVATNVYYEKVTNATTAVPDEKVTNVTTTVHSEKVTNDINSDDIELPEIPIL